MIQMIMMMIRVMMRSQHVDQADVQRLRDIHVESSFLNVEREESGCFQIDLMDLSRGKVSLLVLEIVWRTTSGTK